MNASALLSAYNRNEKCFPGWLQISTGWNRCQFRSSQFDILHEIRMSCMYRDYRRLSSHELRVLAIPKRNSECETKAHIGRSSLSVTGQPESNCTYTRLLPSAVILRRCRALSSQANKFNVNRDRCNCLVALLLTQATLADLSSRKSHDLRN